MSPHGAAIRGRAGWSDQTPAERTDPLPPSRHPNFDARNPLTGGWLFADFHGERWERGVFGQGVGNIHHPGDTLVWRIRVPETGRYRLWMRYAADNASDASDMSGRCVIQVDDNEAMPLRNLPNTGGWGGFCWRKLGRVDSQHSWFRFKGNGFSREQSQNHPHAFSTFCIGGRCHNHSTRIQNPSTAVEWYSPSLPTNAGW